MIFRFLEFDPTITGDKRNIIIFQIEMFQITSSFDEVFPSMILFLISRYKTKIFLTCIKPMTPQFQYLVLDLKNPLYLRLSVRICAMMQSIYFWYLEVGVLEAVLLTDLSSLSTGSTVGGAGLGELCQGIAEM